MIEECKKDMLQAQLTYYFYGEALIEVERKKIDERAAIIDEVKRHVMDKIVLIEQENHALLVEMGRLESRRSAILR